MNRIPFLLASLLAVVSSAPRGSAQSHHHGGGAMAAGRSEQAELGATAVFDPAGTLWAAHKYAGHVVVSRSTDRGRSWTAPVRVNPQPENTDGGADSRPKIAVGGSGEIYVTWTRPMTKPYTGEIRFTRSVDGGKTFLAPVTVHRDRQEITHRFDALAVNPRGQVFIAWIDKRDLVAAAKDKGPAYRGAAVYFAVSDDHGASFRGDFKAADHSCECCRIALVPHADGAVTAMWRHVFEPNIRDHAIARIRPDGTAGKLERATFDDWRIDACPHHGPALAEGANGQLHAVWFSMAPNSQGAFYGRLPASAGSAKRRLGDDTAAHPDVSANGRRVAVAWKEFDGERSRLRGMSSEDGGETWREFDLASTAGPADHPCVLAFSERFYVLWNTRHEPLSVIPFP